MFGSGIEPAPVAKDSKNLYFPVHFKKLSKFIKKLAQLARGCEIYQSIQKNVIYWLKIKLEVELLVIFDLSDSTIEGQVIELVQDDTRLLQFDLDFFVLGGKNFHFTVFNLLSFRQIQAVLQKLWLTLSRCAEYHESDISAKHNQQRLRKSTLRVRVQNGQFWLSWRCPHLVRAKDLWGKVLIN